MKMKSTKFRMMSCSGKKNTLGEGYTEIYCFGNFSFLKSSGYSLFSTLYQCAYIKYFIIYFNMHIPYVGAHTQTHTLR